MHLCDSKSTADAFTQTHTRSPAHATAIQTDTTFIDNTKSVTEAFTQTPTRSPAHAMAVQTGTTVTDNTKSITETFTQTPTRSPAHAKTQTETEVELSEACGNKPAKQKQTTRKSTRQKANK